MNIEQQLPLDLPPTEEELDLRPPTKVEIVRRTPAVCIGNCDICPYCNNSNNRG